jgi:hypothetical protein
MVKKMKIHDIKLSKEICESLLDHVKKINDSIFYKQKDIYLSKQESTSGDRDGVSPFISRTKGGVQESIKVKDMNLFDDVREYKILQGYKNHKESGYSNYTSEIIDTLPSQDLFDYFGLNRKDCKIDVKKFEPGKIHIPHKDYYINYKYDLVDINGNLQYVPNFNKVPIDQKVIRVWITLTKPKFGHILIIENKAMYWLEQGTIITWSDDELHTAANLGYEDRFIMTITGKTQKTIYEK